MSKKELNIKGQDRILGNLQQLQGGGKYPTATPEEAYIRKSTLSTQGKKGAKCDRYNMAFTPENYEYINLVSRIKGMSKTKFVNDIIAEYRAEHSDLYDKAKSIIDEQ